MSFLGMVIVFGILCCFAYARVMLYFRAHAARMMMGDEHPYKNESTDYTKTLLVLGEIKVADTFFTGSNERYLTDTTSG